MSGSSSGRKIIIACGALALVCSASLAAIGWGLTWGLPWSVGAAIAQLTLIARGANRAFVAVCALGAAGASVALARFFEIVLSTAWPDAALLRWSRTGRVSVSLGMTAGWILWALVTEVAESRAEEASSASAS